MICYHTGNVLLGVFLIDNLLWAGLLWIRQVLCIFDTIVYHQTEQVTKLKPGACCSSVFAV